MQAAQKELAHLVGSEGEAQALLGEPGGKLARRAGHQGTLCYQGQSSDFHPFLMP